VRASLGIGNDCEPYLDFGFSIFSPAVLPNCTTVDTLQGEPRAAPILERIYLPRSPQDQAVAVGELDSLAVLVRAERAVAAQRSMTTFAAESFGLADLQRSIESRCGADPVCQQDERDALQYITAIQAMQQSASPTGGLMSSAWFGLGGVAPGGSTPFMPFGASGSAGAFLPSGGDAVGGGLLGAVLNPLLNFGGQFLLQQQQQKSQEDLLKQQLRVLSLAGMAPGFAPLGGMLGQVLGGVAGGMGAAAGNMLLEAIAGQSGGGVGALQGPSWIGVGQNGCCPKGAVTLDPSSAPGLYRQGCSPCSPVQTRARFFASRADGTKDLFVRVGKVQSVSPRTLTRFARRWSREAGLVATKRGGRYRGRRRPR